MNKYEKLNSDMIFTVDNIFNNSPIIKQCIDPNDIDDIKQNIYMDLLESMRTTSTIFSMTQTVLWSILNRIETYNIYHKTNMLCPGWKIIENERRIKSNIDMMIISGE